MSSKLILVSFALSACAAESTRGTASGSPDGRTGPSRDAPCATASEPPPSTGFARHPSGDLIAFEPATGRQLGRWPFGSEIIDLDWAERTQRLLVTSAEQFDVEGSRVHALSFDGSEFTHEASSEVFPGEVRVISSPDRVLVIGAELESDWYELDDELGVVGKSAALPRPLDVAEPDASSVLALRREADADIVYRVSGFAPGWASVELALPRSAPERGVLIARAGEQAWFLGRGDSPAGFQVASLQTAGFPGAGPPAFRTVPGSCGTGAPRALGVDASGCSLVSVSGAELDQLAVVPTAPAATTRCAVLGAPLARSTTWIPRNLHVDRGGRWAWVATVAGVESFALEPSLERVPSFAGTELRAPMTFAR